MDEHTIDYNEQMLDYLPEIFKTIREFRALIASHSIKIEEIHEELPKILSNAYICDADIDTISKWETYLGITPLPQGEDSIETWLEDRRETILARLYSPEKLNSESISNIVKIFTGGETLSHFANGTIYVVITPPKGNKQFKFENVEQELRKKIPAHLRMSVDRNYYTWSETKIEYDTWGDIKNDDTIANWRDLLVKKTLT